MSSARAPVPPVVPGSDESVRLGDVGGEKVDAVAIEVAAGAAVVLGGPRVGMPGEIWASRNGTPASTALLIACRSECGLMWRGIPAAFAIRTTIVLDPHRGRFGDA